MVLRITVGPGSEGVTCGWGKLYTEERHYLYTSPDIVRVTRQEDQMFGTRSTHGKVRNAYVHLSENIKGKDD